MAFKATAINPGAKTQADIIKKESPGKPFIKTDPIKLVGLKTSYDMNKEDLAEMLDTGLRTRPTVMGFEYRWGTSKDSTKQAIELPIDVQTRPRQDIAAALAEMIDSYGNSFIAISFNAIREGETEAFLETLEGGLPEEELSPSMKVTYRPL